MYLECVIGSQLVKGWSSPAFCPTRNEGHTLISYTAHVLQLNKRLDLLYYLALLLMPRSTAFLKSGGSTIVSCRGYSLHISLSPLALFPFPT